MKDSVLFLFSLCMQLQTRHVFKKVVENFIQTKNKCTIILTTKDDIILFFFFNIKTNAFVFFLSNIIYCY